MNTRITGKYYEDKAWQHLKKQGLRLIASNFNCRGGEIDLICLEQNTLVFVEVRYRHQAFYGNALESITYNKQQKIKRAAEYFLLKNARLQKLACRFDVIAIDNKQIDWIKAAFY